jgi:hypothetical protein
VEEPGVDIAPPPTAVVPPPAPAQRPVWVRRAPIPPPPPRKVNDPARSRLSLFSTAETLPRGSWSLTARGMVTLELALGATDWLELGVKSIPVLFFADEGPENNLYMVGGRTRLLKSRWLTLTAETQFVAFLGWAGLYAGLQSRWGSENAAFHLGTSTLQMWGVTHDGWEVTRDCDGPGDCSDPTLSALVVNGGTDLRVSRRVKLMLDVSYFRQDGDGMMLVSPAIRLHGYHFACDLGVVIVHRFDKNIGFAVPLVSLSVSY